MRCGIYVRVSTDEQRDNGYSIDSQLRLIKEYCERNNYDIVDVYNDARHSGKDLMRPEMQRLLKDIKTHKIEKIVAIKVDRLTRNNYDGFWLLNYCEEHDVKIELILESYDISTANGEMIFGMNLVFGQRERKEIGARTKRAMEEMALEKVHPSKAPYGYIRNNETGHLEVEPIESQVVKKIFELYKNHNSIRSIDNTLNEEKAYLKQGKWNSDKVYKILTNSIYIGTFAYGKTKRKAQDILYVNNCKSKGFHYNCDKIEEKLARILNELTRYMYDMDSEIIVCNSTKTKDIKDIDKAIEKLKQQEKRLVDLYLSSSLNVETINHKNDIIKKEIECLNKKKEKIDPNNDFKEYTIELLKKLDCNIENDEVIFKNKLGFTFIFDTLNRKSKKELIKRLIENIEIKNLIYTIRGKQVMLDSDVAMLYHYTTKNINKAVKRNIDRFPEDFCFQLTESEFQDLRFQFRTLNKKVNNGEVTRKYLPYVFTEQGISMLSGVLKNEIAVKVSVSIIRVFVEMRKFLMLNGQVFGRLTSIEHKLLEHDKKFDEVFNQLQQEENIKQKIFFEGQIYDAYSLIIDIIKKANKKILIIDNYIDDSILKMLTKKNKNVEVVILTSDKSNIQKIDIQRFNKEYPILKVAKTNKFHDRFIVIDNKEMYHLGASIKDLGKKCFGIYLSKII